MGVKDKLSGSGGKDTLSGGVGKDILSGGAGKDIFNYLRTSVIAVDTPSENFDLRNTKVSKEIQSGNPVFIS
jgi:hypothetical protein